jgi:hypothetical protein
VQDNRIPQSMSWDVVESKVLVVQTLVRGGVPCAEGGGGACCTTSVPQVRAACHMRLLA